MTITLATPSAKLSKDEAIKVAELREFVKDDLTEFYDTDFNLLRWLQGHPGTVKDVSQKLRKHLKMRKSEWKLDEMQHQKRNHPIHNHWKYGITGESKVLENVIVNIEQSGATDYFGMIQSYSIQEVMKARIPDLEEMLNHCMKIEKETGKQASILYVLDLTDLQYNTRLYNLITGALKSLSEFMAEHYVELIKYFVLINVPSFIYAMWKVASPLLPDRTRQKVRILSSSNWREEILEYASPESLPSKWNTPEISHFKASLDLPVPFREENYFCHNKNNIIKQSEKSLEKIKVVAGKTMILSNDLKKGEKLRWLMSASNDFGMGVFYSKNKEETNVENMQTCYPAFEWMPFSAVPLNDEITALEDGTYIIWISNERAWWSTLNILTKIDVISNSD